MQYLIKDSYHQCEIEKISIRRFQINFQIRAHPLSTYPNFSNDLAKLIRSEIDSLVEIVSLHGTKYSRMDQVKFVEDSL